MDVLTFVTTLPERFLILRRMQHDTAMNVVRLSSKIHHIFAPFK